MGACALVATSEFNAEHFLAQDDAGAFDAVIAVDGGYSHLMAVGRKPDLAIGDFDSLGFVPQDVEVVKHPSHKDKSDLEIAFDYVKDKPYDQIAVYGATGGRLDHMMANLQMAARFAEGGLKVSFIGLDYAIRILVGPGCFELPNLEQGTVSVFAACDRAIGVVEHGMEYPLDVEELTNRTTLGLSNELLGKPASVSVEKGTLYVFHPLGSSAS